MRQGRADLAGESSGAGANLAKEDDNERERDRKRDGVWRTVELVIMGGIVTGVSVVAQIVAAYISKP